jgi:hypothetical protein
MPPDRARRVVAPRGNLNYGNNKAMLKSEQYTLSCDTGFQPVLAAQGVEFSGHPIF